MTVPMKCRVEDCEKPAKARGLCMKHYVRVRRIGDPAPKDPAGWTAAANGDALRRENERLRSEADALRIALREAQAQVAAKPTPDPDEVIDRLRKQVRELRAELRSVARADRAQCGLLSRALPASRRSPRRSGSGPLA